MPIIYSYPNKTNPTTGDLLLISDVSASNQTKKITIGDIQAALSLVSGSGTAGKIPKWSDSNTLTDSVISESSSKIGIGTTSPDGLLHVSAGTQGDARLILEADTDNNDENDVPQIWFKADGDVTEGLIGLNNNFLDIMSNSSLQNGIRFFTGSTSNSGTTDPYTGATEKIRIIPTGELGIGTTSPTEKLDVVGNIKTSGSLSLSKASNSVKISTPATITTSYELVMPGAVGTASQVLKLPSTIGSSPYQLTWGDASGGGGTYSAGDGLDLTGTTFSTDLKANGGLVIEGEKLAVDLAATAITGFLGVADGGTGASHTATIHSTLIGTGTNFSESTIVNTAIQLPVGVTSRRPTAEADNVGLIRYNTSLAKFEGVIESSPGSGTYGWVTFDVTAS